MSLPPPLAELSRKWVGPVTVPDQLPELPDPDRERVPGVYLWVRRYRSTDGPDGELRGLVIYVGADKKGIPSRIFDHVVQLLGGGQSMWDTSGERVFRLTRSEVFRRMKTKLDWLLGHTLAEFNRSEFYYVPCVDPQAVERATYKVIRDRIRQTRKDDQLWFHASMGSPEVDSREDGATQGPFADSEELEGRHLLRWFGLIP